MMRALLVALVVLAVVLRLGTESLLATACVAVFAGACADWSLRR